LDQVIDNLRTVIVGLLVGLATLFATIGGVRYILAGGDPGEVEAAKKTLRYAAIGYAIAVLAPVLVELLQKVVGEAP
ncbi:pilin, partial [Actinomadura sp. CNU-125]